MTVKVSRNESLTSKGTRFSVELNLTFHSFSSMNGVCYTTSSTNWAGGRLIVDMTGVAKDLKTLQSRARYHCKVNLLPQFISLVCTEKELSDQVSCVELASKRIQSF